jgi:hypothetical protein
MSSASSSSSTGADSNNDNENDNRENLAGVDEEEEETENPLQPTQEQEEGSEAGQQSTRQAEDEDEEGEQQAEPEVEEPQEQIQEQVQPAAMADKCNMTPRLQFWYGNSKYRTSIEWWCDAVDRIKDQKGWNDDQGKKSAASVAVDALREEAALLMSIIAKGHQAAAVKDWSLMKPLLIKRYSTIKTCTQRAKQFATLTQKSGEPVENFYDRTQMAMIIVHEKPRAVIPAADNERLMGYNACADGTQALLFVAGLLPYLKTFVEDRIEEDSTLEQILKWAIKGEQSRGGLKGQHSISAVQVEEQQQSRDKTWAAAMSEMEARYKNLLNTELAGVKAIYKDSGAKPKTKPQAKGGRGTGTGNSGSKFGGGTRADLPPLPPMAQRDKWIYCSCCLQWGKHVTRECGYTRDAANNRS